MEMEKFHTLRKEFHRIAELSGQEVRTAEFICQTLGEFSPSTIHSSIGGQGVVAEFRYTSQGPNLLFRADMDAVAIEENSTSNYCSKNPGVAHKCGHDGHTTILLAFAALLHQYPLAKGRILLLFQPAEETGQGAQAILNDPWFKQQKIDMAFALHNLPGYPLHSIVCRSGSFTCSVISCTITLTGKTAHAAEPEKAISPTSALLDMIRESDSWNRGELYSPDYFRSTLIELHIGEKAYGVAAGNGLLRLTLRAATEKQLQKHKQELEQRVREHTSSGKLQGNIEWLEPFTANENTPQAVALIRQAAQQCQLVYQEISHPFAWGEDFGLFTQHFPGAMFGLGAGTSTPALHTPEYDFPNEIISSGAQLFYQLAKIKTTQ